MLSRSVIAAGLILTALFAAPAVSQQAFQLRPGPGSEVVQSVCSGCHTIDLAVGHNRTPEEWNGIIGRMIDLGLTASEDQLDQIAIYLSEQYATPAPGTEASKGH